MEDNFGKKDLGDEDNEGLNAVFPNVTLPSDLEDKVVSNLKRNNLIKSPARLNQVWSKIAASIVLAVSLFSGGFYIGNRFVDQASSPPSQSYILLLYQPSNFIASENHVQEYGAWMRSIKGANTLATGEPLKNYGWTMRQVNNVVTMNNEPATGLNGTLSGFFMLKTASPEQALDIAATCPHLKYNGVVELRPIIDTSN